MSLEDPFLIVQNEVFDALLKLRNQYCRWKDLSENSGDKEEYAASVMELKNGLKSIQWDLDELEESLDSGNYAKLDTAEIEKRRNFITQTREEVKAMNEKLTKAISKPKALVPDAFGSQQNGTRYMRLVNAPDASNQSENILFKAPNFEAEDKSPYVPDHSIMFNETDHTVSVIDSRHSKIDRLKHALHITTERRQWMALGFVSTVFLLIIIAAL